MKLAPSPVFLLQKAEQLGQVKGMVEGSAAFV